MALKLNPGNHQAYNNLGNIYSQDKSWKFAFCYYYQSHQISPNLSVSNNIGVVLRKLGVKRPSSQFSWQQYFEKDHQERKMIELRELASSEGKNLKELIEFA